MFGNLGLKVLTGLTAASTVGLGIALAYVVISKNGEIRAIKDTIENPNTGYKIQISDLKDDLRQCKDNTQTLTTAIQGQNLSNEQFRMTASIVDAMSSAALANSRAITMASTRKTQQIQQFIPNSNETRCEAADRLILITAGDRK